VPTEVRHFCLFGAGALGSQLMNNLSRAGFGRWTIVDNDKLLPHNLARNARGSGEPEVGRRFVLAAHERTKELA
jgi:tRNA A37 threonylcarbamoyladenosine dehydratase